MPYKRGMATLKAKITDPCVREWADDLNPGSRSALHGFLKYLEWVDLKGFWKSAQEMLDDHKRCLKSDDEKEQYKHLSTAKGYIKQKGTGIADRKNTLAAIRSFYNFHHRPLQLLTRSEMEKLFQPSETDTRRAMELSRPLTLDEVHKLILNLPMPYKAIMVTMLQGTMGLAEFELFNRQGWRSIIREIDNPGPLKVNLIRSKTSRNEIRRFYTFISDDAKTQIKEYLKIRPREILPNYLFIAFRKQDENWVPVTGPLIGNHVTATAKKAGLITPSDLKRYRVHPHEIRDLFKSLCSLNGVSKVASEYFMGHSIDRLGYDKSPDYDVEFFRNEYRKVEPFLNIISNPKGLKGTEDTKKEMIREFNHRYLRSVGYTEQEITAFGDLSQLSSDAVQELIDKKTTRSARGPVNGNGNQRVVQANEAKPMLEIGWQFVTTLPNGEIVLKSPA